MKYLTYSLVSGADVPLLDAALAVQEISHCIGIT
jgi:hypothetical protein